MSRKGYHHMPPALVDRIVTLRRDKQMTLQAIAREVGYSSAAVRHRLIERGIDTKRNDPIDAAKQRLIVKMYEGSKTCEEIGAEFGVTGGAIEYWLKKMGVARRSPSEWLRKYTLNEEAFDDLGPEALYWLGFIYADGSIVSNERKRCVRVEVQERDHEHLERLLTFVGSDMQPYKSARRGKGYSTVVLNSAHMVERLGQYGIRPGKSARSERLDDVFANSRDFWRGMVDGDGSIMYHPHRKAYRCYLLANEHEIEQFREYVLARVPKFGGRPTHADGIYRLNISGFAAATVLSDLYSEAVQALPRKSELAEQIIRHFADRDPSDRSRIAWPSVEQLVHDVKSTSFSAVGRKLGVSYVAVREHLRRNGAYPLR
jgi:hypothetical protein